MTAGELAQAAARLWFGAGHGQDCDCPRHVRLAYRPRRERDAGETRTDAGDTPPGPQSQERARPLRWSGRREPIT